MSGFRFALSIAVVLTVSLFSTFATAQGVDISGAWDSDWGPVTINVASGMGVGTVSLTGSWVQPGRTPAGVITKGSFDSAARFLEFDFYQGWNNETGSARLTMAADSNSLSGPWKHSSSSGTWTISRTAAPKPGSLINGFAPGVDPSVRP